MTARLTLILSFIFALHFSQKIEKDSIARKNIIAQKITSPPKIDGILDEEVWQNAAIATDFIERRPNNGAASPAAFLSLIHI